MSGKTEYTRAAFNAGLSVPHGCYLLEGLPVINGSSEILESVNFTLTETKATRLN